MLDGRYEAEAIEIGPDDEVLAEGLLKGETAFGKLLAHMQPYSPEWAEGICDVKADAIRQVAMDYVDHACVGQTIEIDGQTMPYRPVAVSLGKTVNNGWGGFECCWARTMLAVLVGALEVPGGTIGTTVRLVRPMSERLQAAKPGPDGFMHYPLNPTDKATWSPTPNIRNAYKTMVPLAAEGPWSQELGPTHFSWMFMQDTPKGLPRVTLPDVWFVYRTNPAISFWDTESVGAKMAKFPFVVAFAYTRDETNHHADLLLPEATDLESLQLIRIGGTKFIEQFWDHEGFALRQPVVDSRGQARDFTDIASELAQRTGLTGEYVVAINKGAGGVPLRNAHGDFTLDPGRGHGCEDLGRRVPRRQRGTRRGAAAFVLVRIGWAGLAASLVLALALALEWPVPRLQAWFGLAVIGVWLLSFALGMLQRILPFLAAMHGAGAGRRAPTPSSLTHERALAIHFWCHVTALGGLAAAIALDSAWLATAAAAVGAGGTVAFCWFAAVVLGRLGKL